MNIKRQYLVTLETQGVEALSEHDIIVLLVKAIRTSKGDDYMESILKLDAIDLDSQEL